MGSLFDDDFRDFHLALCEAGMRHFGVPIFDTTQENFHNGELDLFKSGIQPTSTDVLTAPKGIDFAECYLRSTWIEHGDLRLRFIGREGLLNAK